MKRLALVFALCASCAAPAALNLNRLADGWANFTNAVAEQISARIVLGNATLPAADFHALTNRLATQYHTLTSIVAWVEGRADGRHFLHGSIVTQKVDSASRRITQVYADGTERVEGFAPRQPMTPEQIARILAAKRNATRNARLRTAPPGLVDVMAERDDAATRTNVVDAVVVPEGQP